MEQLVPVVTKIFRNHQDELRILLFTDIANIAKVYKFGKSRAFE